MDRKKHTISPFENEVTCYEIPPGYDTDKIIEEKGVAIGEAADMYGDLDTAEEYGYVTRGYVMVPATRRRPVVVCHDDDCPV